MFEKEKLDARVKYTRQWTFEALSKILETKTFNEIKISEIIIKAGISRATFYRNFSSKEDIVKYKVNTFFGDFYSDILNYFISHNIEDETILIQSFFKRINEETQLVNTVIKTNLEYLMIEGIGKTITAHSELFYSLVTTEGRTLEYITDIVASSVWTLLSRWHKSGRVETPSQLLKIYLGAFKSVYIALFDDKDKL